MCHGFKRGPMSPGEPPAHNVPTVTERVSELKKVYYILASVGTKNDVWVYWFPAQDPVSHSVQAGAV